MNIEKRICKLETKLRLNINDIRNLSDEELRQRIEDLVNKARVGLAPIKLGDDFFTSENLKKQIQMVKRAIAEDQSVASTD